MATEFLNKKVYSNETDLEHFGGIKIRLENECKLPLKKRDICIMLDTNTEQIIKTKSNERIYSFRSNQNSNKSNGKTSSRLLPKNDETLFWSNLASGNNAQQESGVTVLHNKSFFCQRSNRKSFSTYRLPKKSLLKLGDTQTTAQFVPSLTRSHRSGAIIPLSFTRQHISSLIYHHRGGARHWYIIPNSERENLKKLISNENLSTYLNDSQLLIDRKTFDKYNIRYRRIIQYPNEFVILSSGSLSQSFFEDSSWNETIDFALPNWIEESHAYSTCQCNIKDQNLLYRINLNLSRPLRLQKYINTNLKITPQQQQLLPLEG